MRVKRKINNHLVHSFTKEEVHVALMKMGPLKCPRPNNFGVLFYQHNQDIISNEVISVVLKILQGDSLVSCFNSTYIALIPKLHVRSVVTDFRPISLCNVFYKFLYKVLTNRQKPLIDKIISSL